ncbi:MAG TPA: polysaccharide pyruvyl transferase family protein, partial [Candidatus Cybelea sp.]
MSARVLVSGYYGFGNLGDEALLEVIVEGVRRTLPAAAIEVLSATPQRTESALRIEATPRWEWRAVRGSIRRADVVLSGGGGLLQNQTSLRSLLYYASILREAVRAGRKAMIFAQSIGPLDRRPRQQFAQQPQRPFVTYGRAVHATAESSHEHPAPEVERADRLSEDHGLAPGAYRLSQDRSVVEQTAQTRLILQQPAAAGEHDVGTANR